MQSTPTDRPKLSRDRETDAEPTTPQKTNTSSRNSNNYSEEAMANNKPSTARLSSSKRTTVHEVPSSAQKPHEHLPPCNLLKTEAQVNGRRMIKSTTTNRRCRQDPPTSLETTTGDIHDNLDLGGKQMERSCCPHCDQIHKNPEPR